MEKYLISDFLLPYILTREKAVTMLIDRVLSLSVKSLSVKSDKDNFRVNFRVKIQHVAFSCQGLREKLTQKKAWRQRPGFPPPLEVGVDGAKIEKNATKN